MSHRRHSSILSLIAPILLILPLVLVSSCGEKTTAVDQDLDQSGNTGKGTIDPGATGSFLLGSVSDTSIAPGCIEVWGMNVAYDSAGGFVSFDMKLLNRTQRSIAPPVYFVVTDIKPWDVVLAGFDGVSSDGFPFFDFSSKLGDDSVLTPGESTEAATLKFHTVTPRSFAIGFRIDVGPPSGEGVIMGVVFQDDNQDGKRERDCRCEYGIPGITVALDKPLLDGGMVTLITRTAADGTYSFGGLREGVYNVYVAAEDKWKVTSTNPLLITLVKGADGKVQGFSDADFGLYPLVPRPENLFGPIRIGWGSSYGPSLDSTFVNPPSSLTVVYKYYLWVNEPTITMSPWLGAVDSASAWINGELVFTYQGPSHPDTVFVPHHFPMRIIQLPDGLVKTGENAIRLFVGGDEYAALMWEVHRSP